MPSPWSLLFVAHLVGLSLAVGAATVKLSLLWRCRHDPANFAAYRSVVRPITRLIIAGMVLLTLSGAGMLWLGSPLTARLAIKLALFASIWLIGPLIDNVVEPRFVALLPGAGEAPTPGFRRARAQYLALEMLATGLFYIVIVFWSLT